MAKSEAEIALGIAIKKTYRAFNRKIRTDGDAADLIFNKLKKQKRIRCHCGCTKVHRSTGSRIFVCQACKAKTHFTAGTAYEGAGRLRARLGVIYFAERNLILTASKVAQLFKIGSGTARNIVLNQAIILNETMPDSALELTGHEVASLIYRRSCETPARRPPFAEQEEIDNEVSQSDGSNNAGNCESDITENVDVDGFAPDLSDAQKQVFAALSNVPRSADDLCILTGLPAGIVGSSLVILHLDNLIEELPGARYTRITLRKKSGPLPSSPNDFAMLEILLKAFHTFIKLSSKGVSRKSMQLYLAQFWYYVDKGRWRKNDLFNLYLDHAPLGPLDVRNFVSSNRLKLPLVSI